MRTAILPAAKDLLAVFLSVVVATFFAMLIVTALPAKPVGAACSGRTQVSIWENTGYTGDRLNLTTCSASQPDLRNQHLALNDGCNKGPFSISSNWNDCISSYTMNVAAGECARLYRDINYGNFIWGVGKNASSDSFSSSNLGTDNDTISSIKLGTIEYPGICVTR